MYFEIVNVVIINIIFKIESGTHKLSVVKSFPNEYPNLIAYLHYVENTFRAPLPMMKISKNY